MNNRGWGLQAMLILTFVLILALFISAMLIKQHLSVLVKEESKYQEKYESFETLLETSAKEYVQDKYSNLGNDSLLVEYSTLKNNKYIIKLIDPETSKECDGYVKVENNDYNGFIVCNLNYKTSGYDTNK
jgi:uncharacterized protein YxeA